MVGLQLHWGSMDTVKTQVASWQLGEIMFGCAEVYWLMCYRRH